MSRPKRIISELEKQNICQDYQAGKSIRQLRKETKLQQKQIRNILHENEIKVLSSYESQQKMAGLKVQNYFEELNPLQCYVLGLIFGDGCVYYNEKKYKYAVTLTSNDLDILESGRLLFGEQFKITKRKSSNAYNLVINSKHLCQELITNFKLQSPKSNSLFWPDLPQENYSFFISGLLSTDGCVRIDSRRINHLSGLEFSYSSNCLEFIEQLRKYLSQVLDTPNQGHIKISKTKRKNFNYSLRYSGAHAKTILSWIYNKSDNNTRCDRKYQIFTKFITSLESQTQ